MQGEEFDLASTSCAMPMGGLPMGSLPMGSLPLFEWRQRRNEWGRIKGREFGREGAGGKEGGEAVIGI